MENSKHPNSQDKDHPSSSVDRAIAVVLLVLLVALAVQTVLPLMPALVWALILSVALAGLHQKLTNATGGRRWVATFLLSVLLVIVLLIPLTMVARTLLSILPVVANWISETSNSTSIDELVMPTGQNFVEVLRRDIAIAAGLLSEELRSAVAWVLADLKLVGVFLAEFALGLFLAVALLQAGPLISPVIAQTARRLGGEFGTSLAERARLATRAAVLGLLGSALAQTMAASLAYWAAGAPHWQLLALATFLLAMIQIGPLLIFIPFTIWLWLSGETLTAVIVAIWAIAVVATIDNVIKALVISKGTELPALIALIGAIGGLLTWGIIGLFVGPVVVAVSYDLLRYWIEGAREPVFEKKVSESNAFKTGDKPS